VSAQAAASASPKADLHRSDGARRTQRTIGYITGGLGVFGLAASGLLSYRAYDRNHASLEQCRADDPNACTPEGKEQRDVARKFATGATVAFVSGATLLVGGVVLILSAPKARAAEAATLRISPSFSGNGGGLRLSGQW
jgi:hypothetical protein